jgi:hypothetical protein
MKLVYMHVYSKFMCAKKFYLETGWWIIQTCKINYRDKLFVVNGFEKT